MIKTAVLSVALLALFFVCFIQAKHLSATLGVKYERSDRGWQVRFSQQAVPSVGDVLTDIEIKGQWRPITQDMLLPFFDNVKDLNTLHKALHKDERLPINRPVGFKMSDGGVIYLTPRYDEWSDLNGGFWWNHIFALVCFVISVVIFHFGRFFSSKEPQPTQRVLSDKNKLAFIFVTLGAIVLLSPMSLNREWGVPFTALWSRYIASLFTAVLFALGLTWCFFHYPVNLIKQNRAYFGLMMAIFACFITPVLFIALGWPYAMLLLRVSYIVMGVMVPFLLLNQWFWVKRLDSGRIDKIAIKAVLSFNLFVGALFVLCNVLVYMAFIQKMPSPHLLNCIMSFMVSVSVSILVWRKGLFRVAHLFWWWWPFYGGSMTMLLVLLIGSGFGQYYETNILFLSVLLGSLVFVLVAFKFVYKMMKSTLQVMQNAAVTAQKIPLLELGSRPYRLAQEALFADAFQSTVARSNQQYKQDVEVIDGGERLWVRLVEHYAIVLSAPNNGQRLFYESDVKTALLLHDLATSHERKQQAVERGEKQIRQQVAYDLHDDIGGRLHQMAHGHTPNFAEYAQKTLEQLRTLTHGLHKDSQPLDEFLFDMRYEMQRHAQSYDMHVPIRLVFDPKLSQRILSAHAAVQFRSILSELCRNAAQHKGVSEIDISISIQAEVSEIVVKNDGDETCVADWVAGVGTVSIKRRVFQLGGEVNWLEQAQGGVVATLRFNTKTWFDY